MKDLYQTCPELLEQLYTGFGINGVYSYEETEDIYDDTESDEIGTDSIIYLELAMNTEEEWDEQEDQAPCTGRVYIHFFYDLEKNARFHVKNLWPEGYADYEFGEDAVGCSYGYCSHKFTDARPGYYYAFFYDTVSGESLGAQRILLTDEKEY